MDDDKKTPTERPAVRKPGFGKPAFGKPGFQKRGPEKRAGGAQRERSRSKVDAPEAVEAGERIAKRLARAGVASRREAEALITDGRIRVNGETLTSPARNVRPEDRIELDGQLLPPPERTRLFLFHKPAGVVTTNHDPEGRRTVFDALPEGLPRLMTVGRLDINTEGLLLLTNDGGLARVLELPATGWLRRYRVRVHGEVDEVRLKELSEGIAVDGVFYGAIEASLERKQGTNAWLSVQLREGKNREVKNVLGSLGLDVTRLIRVSFGPFQLAELEEGQVQELKGRTLRDQLGERLIEEAGADFEGEIQKPFSNKPVRRGQEPEQTRIDKPAAPARLDMGEGGLVKNRKRFREERREDALGRLGTTAPKRFGKPSGERRFGEKPGRKREDEAARFPERERGRTTNVWMAPGARPQSEARQAAAEENKSDKPEGGRTPYRARREADPAERASEPGIRRPRGADTASGSGRPSDRPRADGDKPQFRKPHRPEGREGGSPREDRPRRPNGGEHQGRREGFDEKPRRAAADPGEGARPFRKRFEGADRPQGAGRPERPHGERPQGERSRNPRPQDGRPNASPPKRFNSADESPGGRPQGRTRSESDRPADGKPTRTFKGGFKSGAPRSDRPGGGQPRSSAPGGFRPEGGRVARENRPRGERPAGAAPFKGPRKPRTGPEGGAGGAPRGDGPKRGPKGGNADRRR